MKKRIIALLLTFGLIAASAVTVRAAEIENVPVAAEIDAGIVAADFDDVGSEPQAQSDLPSAYSSRELGYTTSVLSQNYNTCWAYSSAAVTEVLLNKLGIGIDHISTMSMNYWATTRESNTGWQRSYASAGYPYIALGYLTSIGIIKEEDFPSYSTYEDYQKVEDELTPYGYVDSVIYLNGSDVDTVKTAVYNNGAAVGNFHYDASRLNDSVSAYYCDVETIATANLFGHAVAIVGWDDSYDKDNFVEGHRPENDGAWLCKNSWGAYWGSLGGYFWISYEDKHLFDKRFGPSYSIAGVSLGSPRTRIRQNEVYGATYEFDYLSGTTTEAKPITYVNVIDLSDGFNIIDKVVFESTAEGSDYEIYYIPLDEEGIPDSDESDWVLLYEGTVSYKGYFCAEIEDFEAPMDKGAIGVRLRRTEASDTIGIGVDEWLTAASKEIFKPDSTHGMSYLLGYSSEAVDVMDYYADVLDDKIGGTFVIKALTTTDRLTGDVDADGEITILDATYIQRYLAAIDDFDDVQMVVADFDHDGSVTILDATRIQRCLAGLFD